MSKGGAPEIPKDYTFKIGSDGSVIHIDSDLDNIHIAEIAPINVSSTLAVPEPIVTKSSSDSDAKIDLKVEPLNITSDSKSLIDLKPLAIDSCQTIKIAPLPPIRMEQPYSQHFGFTFMGMELFGFTTSGKYETLLNSPSKPSSSCGCHSSEGHHAPSSEKPDGTVTRTGGGLRVRINNS
jgi:hypothetical protein